MLNIILQPFAFLQVPGTVSRWCFMAAFERQHQCKQAHSPASHMKIKALVWNSPRSWSHTQQSSSSTLNNYIKKSASLTKLPLLYHTHWASAQHFQNKLTQPGVSFWRASSSVQERLATNLWLLFGLMYCCHCKEAQNLIPQAKLK